MTHTEQGLNFDLILSAVKVPHRKQVFQAMAEETSKIIGIREKLLSSRMDNAADTVQTHAGVCFIEMKISSLTQPFTVLARAPNGVDAHAEDGLATDLFAMYLYPEHGGAVHLQTLARWSRLFKDDSFCAALRRAENDEDIRTLVRMETKIRQQAA